MGGIGFAAGRKKDIGQDFEINIASIIDCLTVLIMYMLVSASFLSLGVFDVNVATQGDGNAANDGSVPPVSIAVRLYENHGIHVSIAGQETRTIAIPPKDGNWHFEALAGHLRSIRESWPKVNSTLLVADNRVEYREIVKALESVRQAVPVVLLGDQTIE